MPEAMVSSGLRLRQATITAVTPARSRVLVGLMSEC